MGHDEMVELLVSSGADINSRGHPNSNQGTPIQGICSDRNKNYENILKYLINNGAKLDIKSSDGSSPIVKAAGWCPLPILKILLDHGADPFEKDFYGNSLLHIAVQRLPNEPNFKDRLTIIKTLLKKGLSINSENSEGITPLDLIKANKDKELEDLVNKLTRM
jgi:ankyrin repeat protein